MNKEVVSIKLTLLIVVHLKGCASGRFRKFLGELLLRNVAPTQIIVETTHWNHVTNKVASSFTL